VIESDARHLPFPDGSLDVAHCSLVVHHLDADDAVAALGEMASSTTSGAGPCRCSRPSPAPCSSPQAASRVPTGSPPPDAPTPSQSSTSCSRAPVWIAGGARPAGCRAW
jgi:hypothetical protein